MTGAEVTAADISRMAGVTRATVSNWRRRHPDFPVPTGGTETSPAYDLAQVRDWLASRGQLPELSPLDDLRAALRQDSEGAAGLLPLVPALGRLEPEQLKKSRELRGQDLAEEVTRLLNLASPVEAAPEALLALVRCVSEEGAEQAFEAFQEVLVLDSAQVTPRAVVDLMIDLLPTPNAVLDPACGTGRLLSAAARRGATRILGQDVVATHATLSEVRMQLEAPEVDQEVFAGDSLRHDAFTQARVDAVLCNPPFGVRDWGHDDLAYDPRWAYGLPPRSESELAWVQHCLAHLEPGGHLVVLMPPGAAERTSGRRVRAELIRRGALRAVIALPPGAAPPLHLGLHLWVLTRPGEDAESGGSVLFVDAAAEDTPYERIVELWRDFDEAEERFEPVAGLAQQSSVVDLLDATVDVTPARRVHAGVVVAPEEQAAQAEELRSRLASACDELVGLADAAHIGGQTPEGNSWGVARQEPANWRSATVADLLRGGALTLHRANPVRRGGSARNADAVTGDMPVLTLSDIRGEGSGSSRDKPAEPIQIEYGDVIMPEPLHGVRSVPVRVADEGDVGTLLGPHLFLLRPDPERLDPWFLAGFLSADENTHRATTGTSIVRLDVKRLRVPLMPPESQRDYGKAFQHLFRLRQAAALASTLAEDTARQWATGLTSGALLPPEAHG